MPADGLCRMTGRALIRNHEEPGGVKVMKKTTVADDLVDRLAEEVKKNDRIKK
jgi:hypothetical protein